ncbi:MAG TPA: hypothetical protein VLE22_19425 [Bryobacteraceae bacterium]|nr:hypothetical protein [Bryobacteraceae bacterium]
MSDLRAAWLCRRWVFAACLTVLFLIGATAQPPRANMNEAPDNAPLKLVITSSRQRVMQNESFVLEAKLVNVSGERVSIFGQLLWGYAGGLTLHVSDQCGRPVQAEQHDDDMVVPSVLGNPEFYVVLFPDHFLGIDRKDSPKNLFRKPGSYSLFAEYQSPVPDRYAKAPNFWGRERGSIRSAPIRIEVIEK